VIELGPDEEIRQIHPETVQAYLVLAQLEAQLEAWATPRFVLTRGAPPRPRAVRVVAVVVEVARELHAIFREGRL